MAEKRAGRWGADLPPVGEGLQVRLVPIDGVTNASLMPREYVFQCPPWESFKRSYSQQWNDYDSIDGPRSRPVNRTLTVISFSTLVVGLRDLGHGYPWTVVDPAPISFTKRFKHQTPDLQDAQTRTNQLLDILRSATPFRLIAANPSLWNYPDVDMPATLRTLDVEERMGEVEARYLDVSFSEFFDPNIPDAALPTAGTAAKLPITLRIADLNLSDSMHELARNYYGDPGGWKPIAAANRFLAGIGPSASIRHAFGTSKTHRSVTIPKVTRVV